MEAWSLNFSVVAFGLSSLATILGGIRLATTGDQLADRSGMGEALFGALFFGALISASGIVMTAAVAAAAQPELAYSSAVGGIAAQTTALVAADLFYRRANLEHAAASLPNIMFGVLLIMLLVIAAAVSFLPDVTIFGVHPGSGVLVISYVFGLRSVKASHAQPGWYPRQTRETVIDEQSEPDNHRSLVGLWIEFVLVGAFVACNGWVIGRAAEVFVVAGDLEASMVGAILMGLVNAAPEAVTSIAAVRRGALTLAVAGVLGGNAFDVLNLVVADVFYQRGSIYHAAGRDEIFLILASTLLSAVIVSGLLRREPRGPARIGSESWLILFVYATTLVLIAL